MDFWGLARCSCILTRECTPHPNRWISLLQYVLCLFLPRKPPGAVPFSSAFRLTAAPPPPAHTHPCDAELLGLPGSLPQVFCSTARVSRGSALRSGVKSGRFTWLWSPSFKVQVGLRVRGEVRVANTRRIGFS